MHVDRVFTGADAVVVGGAVDDPSFDAATGEPGGEDLVMMLTAGVGGLFVVGGAAELGGPDDERFVEEAPLLEVRDQGGDGLVDVFGESHVVLHVAVRVPVAGRANVDQLDETDAPLHHPPSLQTLPAEAASLTAGEAVEAECCFGFLREVKGFGGG